MKNASYAQMESGNPLEMDFCYNNNVANAHITIRMVTAYSAAVVLQAFVLTAGITLCLTLYTFQSKRDFKHWGLGLFLGLIVLLLAGPVNYALGSSLFELSLAIGGAVLFSLLIIYDTHRIMHHCSAEDYILACIDLYLDILNLFMHLLRILKELDRN